MRRKAAAVSAARERPIATRGNGKTCCSRTSTRRRRVSGSRRSTPSCEHDGPDRAQHLLERVVGHAQLTGAAPAPAGTTPYINTIPPQHEPEYPVDERARAARALARCAGTRSRWCCSANKESSELGGHIASYQSAAVLYEIGFNHFWHAPSDEHGGDLVYMQGHSSPGIYARAFLEGRLTEEQLRRLPPGGLAQRRLPSYPHPWLMPDFWQFPTVSMGLGPIMAIYQARFMKYLAGPRGRRHGAAQGLGVPGRRRDGRARVARARSRWPAASSLDNLIFVVNCNLQRLDGPVRGNGKIIQELETIFRGAGWNVIKVIWGSRWDPLLARRPRRPAAARGWRRRSTATTRPTSRATAPTCASTSSAPSPELRERWSRDMTDEEIWALNRGGHDAAQGLRRLHGGGRAHRPADGDPRQDDQGLRDGRGRRGPEHHPPAEEDDRGRAAGLPRPLRAAAHRRAGRATSPSTSPPEDSPEMALPARAPRGAGRLACRRAGAAAEPLPVPELSSSSSPSSRAPASARSRRRWRSSACSSALLRDKQHRAATSCRSCPTSRARSAWRGCSASSGSSARSASSTRPRTPSS